MGIWNLVPVWEHLITQDRGDIFRTRLSKRLANWWKKRGLCRDPSPWKKKPANTLYAHWFPNLVLTRKRLPAWTRTLLPHQKRADSWQTQTPQKQCSGIVTFWYGSGSLNRWHGSGSCSFLQWLSRCQLKIKKIFITYRSIHLHQSSNFKDNKLQRSHRTVEIKGFLLIFFTSWWKVPYPDPCK